MKLKKTIQIIEYSNLALIGALFILVIILVYQAGEGQWLVLEALILMPFILAFFFRKIIIGIYLKKSAYPGVFYSVLDKMGLARNLELTVSDEILDEIYKPAYSTTGFLNDNNLKTEIGKKKMQVPATLIIPAVAMAAFFFFYRNKIKSQHKSYLVISGIVFLVPLILFWIKGAKQQNDEGAVVKFNKDALLYFQQKLDWKNIYDWNYLKGSEPEASGIVINHYDEEKNIRETMINLSGLNIDKIDFLMLLTHFKGKCGQVQQAS